MRYRSLLVLGFALLLLPGVAVAQDNGLIPCGDDDGARGVSCDGLSGPGGIGQVNSAGDAHGRLGLARRLLEERRGEEEGEGASADLGRGFGAFVHGRLGFRDQDVTARENESDGDSLGLVLGGDWRSGPMVLGLAFDYTRTDTDFKGPIGVLTNARVGSVESDEFGLQAFDLFEPAPQLSLSGLARIGRNSYDTSRRINGGSVSGSTDGTVFGAAAGANYDLPVGAGVTLGLSGLLDFQRTRIDGYSESPLPGLAGERVRFNRDRITTLTSHIGARVSRAFSTESAVLVPYLGARWLHEFDDDSRTLRTTVVDGGGNPIAFADIQTNAPDRDHFAVDLGLSAVFAGGWSAFAAYDVLLGHSFRKEHNIAIGLRREF